MNKAILWLAPLRPFVKERCTHARHDSDGELLAYLQQNYEMVRVLRDGSFAALHPLIYTTAIFLGLDRWGWRKRYCFKDSALALQRFDALQSEDDVPKGWVAQR